MVMQHFELYIEPIRINPKNGKFRSGHIPFNKGKKMTEWMDGRKIKKVMKGLEIGRKAGNAHFLHKFNKIEIVGIKEGKLTAFESAADAERILRAKGVKVNQRNIRAVCLGTIEKGSYVRLRAGGYRWFYAKDVEKYKSLISC